MLYINDNNITWYNEFMRLTYLIFYAGTFFIHVFVMQISYIYHIRN